MMVRDIAGKLSGTRTFIEELEKTIPEFYENVGQHLAPYRPKPPQVKAKKKETDSGIANVGRNSEAYCAEFVSRSSTHAG
jgi:hypothetical protein